MKTFLAAVSAVALTACGGGGGGGGSGGSSGTPTTLAYTGATTQATISATNAAKLTNNVVGTGATAVSGGVSGVSVSAQSGSPSASGISAVAHTLGGGVRAARVPAMPGGALASTAQSVDTTSACDSGSVHITGSIDDVTGIGSATFAFNDCRSGTDTLSGTALAQVTAYDRASSTITDMTVTFTLLSIRGTGVSLDFAGSFRDQISFATNTETLTANFVIRDNLTANLLRAENLVYADVYNNVLAPSFFTEFVSGRIYDKTEGYVDISTPIGFHFASLTQTVPDAGQMVLRGASNAAVRVTMMPSGALTIALDLNGDGTYESTAISRWTDLGGAAASDLRDTDGDGMHNSWETANGLNPNDPSDASADADGDGATNLAEYLAGTDPRNAASKPVTTISSSGSSGTITVTTLGSTQTTAPLVTASSLPLFIAPKVTVTGVRDLVFDSGTGKIFAAAVGNPGKVVPIDPVARTLGSAITVGIDPVKLARSDDGQYLYVALDGEPAVQRIPIAGSAPDLKFGLGSDSFFGSFYVEDMQVLPGNAHAIAASLMNKAISPRHAGVAIFDDGVARPTMTPRHTGANRIEFSSSASTIYGYCNETTGYGFYRLAVNASGVSIIDVWDSFHAGGALIDGFGVDIAYGGGMIYSTSGRVVDPAVPAPAGAVSLPSSFGNLVAVDASIGRAFYLASESSGYTLRAFDTTTQLQLGGVFLGSLSGTASSLIRWGAKGLAFRVGDNIYFVESTQLIP